VFGTALHRLRWLRGEFGSIAGVSSARSDHLFEDPGFQRLRAGYGACRVDPEVTDLKTSLVLH